MTAPEGLETGSPSRMNNKHSGQTLKGGRLNETTVKDRIWQVTQGTFLEKMFTFRNAMWLIAFVLLIIAQNANSYTLLRNKKEVASLAKEISELRMEKITVETTLMGAHRLSSIENRVQEENLDLSIPKNPPIIIEK